jgi:hypothetical protein
MKFRERLTARIVDKFEAEAEAWHLSTDSGDRLAGIAAGAAVTALSDLLTTAGFHQDVVRHLQSLSDEPWPPYPAEVLAATARVIEDLS